MTYILHYVHDVTTTRELAKSQCHAQYTSLHCVAYTTGTSHTILSRSLHFNMYSVLDAYRNIMADKELVQFFETYLYVADITFKGDRNTETVLLCIVN